MTDPNLSHPEHPDDRTVYRQYLIVWGELMILLLATVLAASINIGEPWSFLIALLIAVVKAVLVILFFMHVKDASHVTWVFCGSAFLWLGIMLALTFGDYATRPHPPEALNSTAPGISTAAHIPVNP